MTGRLGSMILPVFVTGLSIGISLIGAQNAFVLRQGLRGEHVFATRLTCAVSNAILIGLCVTSFSRIATVLHWVAPVKRYGGAAFPIWYGAHSLRSALRTTDALAVISLGQSA